MNYNDKAAICMATGVGPNLENVYVKEVLPSWSAKLRSVYKRQPPPWQGFFMDRTLDSYPQGRLRTLSLDPARIYYFQDWRRQVDLSALNTLHLWQACTGTLAEESLCRIPSPKTLVLDADDEEGRDTAPGLDEAGSALLLSLPPLENLHLSGHFAEQSFRAVLDHHGGSLHKLALLPIFEERFGPFLITPERIDMIRRHCPNVYDLRLRMHRSKGNRQEVEMYRALGTLPKLRELSLQLDSSGPNEPPSAQAPSPQDTANRFRDRFVNAALDEPLARVIFSVIAERSLVERLTLKRTGLDFEEKVFELMKRRWRCIRLPGGTTGHKVLVEELGAEWREFWDCDDDGSDIPASLGEYEPAFRQLWPETTGSWKRDWHSFPLSLDD